MRVFKNKWFSRWARKENIADRVLLDAAQEIAAGRVEADLGGCLFKKRLQRTGTGKRGSYRVLVGYRKPDTDRIIFLYAFAKNDKASLSANEQTALYLVAESFVSATDHQIQMLVEEGTLREVLSYE